jgi:hypothetical protein
MPFGAGIVANGLNGSDGWYRIVTRTPSND